MSRLDRIDEVRDYVWAPLSAPEQEEVLDAIPGLLTIARAAQTVVGQPTFHWESREVLALIDALADFEAGQ